MDRLYVPREQFSTITADDLSARPLAATVAPVALAYDERLTQARIQHVENPRRAVTRWLCRKIATHLAQQMGILLDAASSIQRTDLM